MNEEAVLLGAGWPLLCGKICCPNPRVLGSGSGIGGKVSKIMIDHGADSTRIQTLPLGTSTWEEYESILAYCQEKDLHKVMVLSSRFHTRRIYRVFEDSFEAAGIELVIRGAPESGFEEDR
jgi:hypothetical protein